MSATKHQQDGSIDDDSGQPLRRKAIAIVGGGCAGLSAAWDLTSPDNPNRCDVTVFQMGGRLGGKGASSRNAEHGQRIEEHGLHLWLGYYENAFRMVRGCYEELKHLDPADAELQAVWRGTSFDNWDWRAAFERASVVGLADDAAGDWEPWVARFPEYVLRSEGVAGVYETVDGASLPGVHVVEDPRHAYPGEPPGELPEDEDDLSACPSVAFFLSRALRDLQAFFVSLEDRIEETGGRTERAAFEDDAEDLLAHALRSAAPDHRGTGEPDVLRLLRSVRLTILVPAMQATAGLARLIDVPIPYMRTRVVEMLDRFVDIMRERIELEVQTDLVARRIWELIDLLAANIRGVIVAGLEGERDFSSLDEWNYVDWLRMNRISERTLRNPIIRGSHDLAFAYLNGNENEPQFAAGQALNAACRFFFTYKGALFWRMRAGMGDVVFAPLYMALRQRGVKFRFFHRLDAIELDGSGTTVAALSFQRQVKLRNEHPVAATNYQPLVLVRDMACWPARNDAAQFDLGAVSPEREQEAAGQNFESIWCAWPAHERVRITVGDAPPAEDSGAPIVGHYDAVIVTVPVAALERVSDQLVDSPGPAGERWQGMLKNVGTVATQSAQIWTTCDTRQLGWTHGQVSLSGFVHPFDTWADLSHLTAVEHQPLARGVHYLCSALPDFHVDKLLRPPFTIQSIVQSGGARDPFGDALRAAKATVRENTKRFLVDAAGELWPLAVRRYPTDFRWELLLAEPKAEGDARLDAQHFVANVDPSERYTQSLPGTTKHRIPPGDTGFKHLYIAGDWTDCGLNVGCVEAAVMSGRLASSAITRYPTPRHIPGFPIEGARATAKGRS